MKFASSAEYLTHTGRNTAWITINKKPQLVSVEQQERGCQPNTSTGIEDIRGEVESDVVQEQEVYISQGWQKKHQVF